MQKRAFPFLSSSGVSMRTSKPSLRPAARRSRTKTRKPKFMSLLRIDLSNTTAEMSDRSRRHGRGQSGRQHPQLDLFPLHPETADSLVDDTRDDENININLLFNGDDTSATTLSCLLDGGDAITPARASAVACSEEGYVGSRGELTLSHRFNHHITFHLLIRLQGFTFYIFQGITCGG